MKLKWYHEFSHDLVHSTHTKKWGNIIPVFEIYYLVQQINCFGHQQTKLVRDVFIVSLLSYTLTKTKISTDIRIETIFIHQLRMRVDYIRL